MDKVRVKVSQDGARFYVSVNGVNLDLDAPFKVLDTVVDAKRARTWFEGYFAKANPNAVIEWE